MTERGRGPRARTAAPGRARRCGARCCSPATGSQRVDLQDPDTAAAGLSPRRPGGSSTPPSSERLVDTSPAGSAAAAGRLPTRDLEGRPCTVLADALGLRPGNRAREPTQLSVVRGSVTARGRDAETRVGWLQRVLGARPAGRGPVDVDGRVCGLEARVGAGRAIVLTAEVPSPRLFAALAADLGVTPGLRLASDIPGVVATTTRSPGGDRMLHLLNPTGFHAAVTVGLDGADPADLTVPAHTGHLLGARTQHGVGAVGRRHQRAHRDGRHHPHGRSVIGRRTPAGAAHRPPGDRRRRHGHGAGRKNRGDLDRRRPAADGCPWLRTVHRRHGRRGAVEWIRYPQIRPVDAGTGSPTRTAPGPAPA